MSSLEPINVFIPRAAIIQSSKYPGINFCLITVDVPAPLQDVIITCPVMPESNGKMTLHMNGDFSDDPTSDYRTITFAQQFPADANELQEVFLTDNGKKIRKKGTINAPITIVHGDEGVPTIEDTTPVPTYKCHIFTAVSPTGSNLLFSGAFINLPQGTVLSQTPILTNGNTQLEYPIYFSAPGPDDAVQIVVYPNVANPTDPSEFFTSLCVQGHDTKAGIFQGTRKNGEVFNYYTPPEVTFTL